MEQIPKPEDIAEARLIRLLKEKGPDDPEAREVLVAWVREQERIVEDSEDSEAAINLNIRRGRLYFSAGYNEEALENLESAATQAWNEDRIDLYEAIAREYEKMKIKQE